jgi:hypothetical protein
MAEAGGKDIDRTPSQDPFDRGYGELFTVSTPDSQKEINREYEEIFAALTPDLAFDFSQINFPSSEAADFVPELNDITVLTQNEIEFRRRERLILEVQEEQDFLRSLMPPEELQKEEEEEEEQQLAPARSPWEDLPFPATPMGNQEADSSLDDPYENLPFEDSGVEMEDPESEGATVVSRKDGSDHVRCGNENCILTLDVNGEAVFECTKANGHVDSVTGLASKYLHKSCAYCLIRTPKGFKILPAQEEAVLAIPTTHGGPVYCLNHAEEELADLQSGRFVASDPTTGEKEVFDVTDANVIDEEPEEPTVLPTEKETEPVDPSKKGGATKEARDQNLEKLLVDFDREDFFEREEEREETFDKAERIVEGALGKEWTEGGPDDSEELQVENVLEDDKVGEEEEKEEEDADVLEVTGDCDVCGLRLPGKRSRYCDSFGCNFVCHERCGAELVGNGPNDTDSFLCAKHATGDIASLVLRRYDNNFVDETSTVRDYAPSESEWKPSEKDVRASKLFKKHSSRCDLCARLLYWAPFPVDGKSHAVFVEQSDDFCYSAARSATTKEGSKCGFCGYTYCKEHMNAKDSKCPICSDKGHSHAWKKEKHFSKRLETNYKISTSEECFVHCQYCNTHKPVKSFSLAGKMQGRTFDVCHGDMCSTFWKKGSVDSRLPICDWCQITHSTRSGEQKLLCKPCGEYEIFGEKATHKNDFSKYLISDRDRYVPWAEDEEVESKSLDVRSIACAGCLKFKSTRSKKDDQKMKHCSNIKCLVPQLFYCSECVEKAASTAKGRPGFECGICTSGWSNRFDKTKRPEKRVLAHPKMREKSEVLRLYDPKDVSTPAPRMTFRIVAGNKILSKEGKFVERTPVVAPTPPPTQKKRKSTLLEGPKKKPKKSTVSTASAGVLIDNLSPKTKPLPPKKKKVVAPKGGPDPKKVPTAESVEKASNLFATWCKRQFIEYPSAVASQHVYSVLSVFDNEKLASVSTQLNEQKERSDATYYDALEKLNESWTAFTAELRVPVQEKENLTRISQNALTETTVVCEKILQEEAFSNRLTSVATNSDSKNVFLNLSGLVRSFNASTFGVFRKDREEITKQFANYISLPIEAKVNRAVANNTTTTTTTTTAVTPKRAPSIKKSSPGVPVTPSKASSETPSKKRGRPKTPNKKTVELDRLKELDNDSPPIVFLKCLEFAGRLAGRCTGDSITSIKRLSRTLDVFKSTFGGGKGPNSTLNLWKSVWEMGTSKEKTNFNAYHKKWTALLREGKMAFDRMNDREEKEGGNKYNVVPLYWNWLTFVIKTCRLSVDAIRKMNEKESENEAGIRACLLVNEHCYGLLREIFIVTRQVQSRKGIGYVEGFSPLVVLLNRARVSSIVSDLFKGESWYEGKGLWIPVRFSKKLGIVADGRSITKAEQVLELFSKFEYDGEATSTSLGHVKKEDEEEDVEGGPFKKQKVGGRQNSNVRNAISNPELFYSLFKRGPEATSFSSLIFGEETKDRKLSKGFPFAWDDDPLGSLPSELKKAPSGTEVEFLSEYLDLEDSFGRLNAKDEDVACLVGLDDDYFLNVPGKNLRISDNLVGFAWNLKIDRFFAFEREEEVVSALMDYKHNLQLAYTKLHSAEKADPKIKVKMLRSAIMIQDRLELLAVNSMLGRRLVELCDVFCKNVDAANESNDYSAFERTETVFVEEVKHCYKVWLFYFMNWTVATNAFPIRKMKNDSTSEGVKDVHVATEYFYRLKRYIKRISSLLDNADVDRWINSTGIRALWRNFKETRSALNSVGESEGDATDVRATKLFLRADDMFSFYNGERIEPMEEEEEEDDDDPKASLLSDYVSSQKEIRDLKTKRVYENLDEVYQQRCISSIWADVRFFQEDALAAPRKGERDSGQSESVFLQNALDVAMAAKSLSEMSVEFERQPSPSLSEDKDHADRILKRESKCTHDKSLHRTKKSSVVFVKGILEFLKHSKDAEKERRSDFYGRYARQIEMEGGAFDSSFFSGKTVHLFHEAPRPAMEIVEEEGIIDLDESEGVPAIIGGKGRNRLMTEATSDQILESRLRKEFSYRIDNLTHKLNRLERLKKEDCPTERNRHDNGGTTSDDDEEEGLCPIDLEYKKIIDGKIQKTFFKKAQLLLLYAALNEALEKQKRVAVPQSGHSEKEVTEAKETLHRTLRTVATFFKNELAEKSQKYGDEKKKKKSKKDKKQKKDKKDKGKERDVEEPREAWKSERFKAWEKEMEETLRKMSEIGYVKEKEKKKGKEKEKKKKSRDKSKDSSDVKVGGKADLIAPDSQALSDWEETMKMGIKLLDRRSSERISDHSIFSDSLNKMAVMAFSVSYELEDQIHRFGGGASKTLKRYHEAWKHISSSLRKEYKREKEVMKMWRNKNDRIVAATSEDVSYKKDRLHENRIEFILSILRETTSAYPTIELIKSFSKDEKARTTDACETGIPENLIVLAHQSLEVLIKRYEPGGWSCTVVGSVATVRAMDYSFQYGHDFVSKVKEKWIYVRDMDDDDMNSVKLLKVALEKLLEILKIKSKDVSIPLVSEKELVGSNRSSRIAGRYNAPSSSTAATSIKTSSTFKVIKEFNENSVKTIARGAKTYEDKHKKSVNPVFEKLVAWETALDYLTRRRFYVEFDKERIKENPDVETYSEVLEQFTVRKSVADYAKLLIAYYGSENQKLPKLGALKAENAVVFKVFGIIEKSKIEKGLNAEFIAHATLKLESLVKSLGVRDVNASEDEEPVGVGKKYLPRPRVPEFRRDLNYETHGIENRLKDLRAENLMRWIKVMHKCDVIKRSMNPLSVGVLGHSDRSYESSDSLESFRKWYELSVLALQALWWWESAKTFESVDSTLTYFIDRLSSSEFDSKEAEREAFRVYHGAILNTFALFDVSHWSEIVELQAVVRYAFYASFFAAHSSASLDDSQRPFLPAVSLNVGFLEPKYKLKDFEETSPTFVSNWLKSAMSEDAESFKRTFYLAKTVFSVRDAVGSKDIFVSRSDGFKTGEMESRNDVMLYVTSAMQMFGGLHPDSSARFAQHLDEYGEGKKSSRAFEFALNESCRYARILEESNHVFDRIIWPTGDVPAVTDRYEFFRFMAHWTSYWKHLKRGWILEFETVRRKIFSSKKIASLTTATKGEMERIRKYVTYADGNYKYGKIESETSAEYDKMLFENEKTLDRLIRCKKLVILINLFSRFSDQIKLQANLERSYSRLLRVITDKHVLRVGKTMSFDPVAKKTISNILEEIDAKTLENLTQNEDDDENDADYYDDDGVLTVGASKTLASLKRLAKSTKGAASAKFSRGVNKLSDKLDDSKAKTKQKERERYDRRFEKLNPSSSSSSSSSSSAPSPSFSKPATSKPATTPAVKPTTTTTSVPATRTTSNARRLLDQDRPLPSKPPAPRETVEREEPSEAPPSRLPPPPPSASPPSRAPSSSRSTPPPSYLPPPFPAARLPSKSSASRLPPPPPPPPPSHSVARLPPPPPPPVQKSASSLSTDDLPPPPPTFSSGGGGEKRVKTKPSRTPKQLQDKSEYHAKKSAKYNEKAEKSGVIGDTYHKTLATAHAAHSKALSKRAKAKSMPKDTPENKALRDEKVRKTKNKKIKTKKALNEARDQHLKTKEKKRHQKLSDTKKAPENKSRRQKLKNKIKKTQAKASKLAKSKGKTRRKSKKQKRPKKAKRSKK